MSMPPENEPLGGWPETPPVRKPEKFAPTPQVSRNSIASVVLGCLSFVFCTVTGLPAIIYGMMGLFEVSRSRGAVSDSGLAILGMILAVVGSCVPLLMLFPAVGGAREGARRNGCMSNIRQLGLAAANHESALKRYPLLNSNGVPLTDQIPGAVPTLTPNSANDYSFNVKLLPYMGERLRYDSIRTKTGDFRNEGGAFGRTADDDPIYDNGMHCSEMQVASLRCPSYSGDIVCMPDAQYAGAGILPAVGNYVAIVATDLEGADGKLPAWKRAYQSWENGGMVSSCYDGPDCMGKGLKINQIGDGISKTVVMTESHERRYASWFSSASTWVVAATGGSDPRESRGAIGTASDGFVDLTQGHLALNWGDIYSYNYGERDVYLVPAANRWAAKRERVFGPSSEHGGVVLHVFFDNHAQIINENIDPQVYLRLVTRADGDPVDLDGL